MTEQYIHKDPLAEQKKTVLSIIEQGIAFDREDAGEDLLRYSTGTAAGAQICAAFSEEELLELLRQKADELGHSPAQGEVHWLLRDYLRHRFKNWPGALRAAGLSRSAGRGGLSTEQMEKDKEAHRRMLCEVREMAERLGRIPHPSELPETCRRLKKYYKAWGEVLAAAGVEEAVANSLAKAERLSDEELHMLRRLRSMAEELNRAPLRSEVEQSLREPLLRRFGSWRNVLYQIDLSPVQRMTPFVNAPLQREGERRRAMHRQGLVDCRYRLLKLDDQTAADLEMVRSLAEQLGRLPDRRDVPPEVRKRLREACGSWSNALFQLDLPEKEQ